MKEAFEKIRKRMEKATEFLSDCTKYGNKDAVQQRKSYDTMYMYEIALLVEELIDIVSEVEAEYGNGKTNADRIRKMSDGELAEFLSNQFCHGFCEQQMVAWLKSEANL